MKPEWYKWADYTSLLQKQTQKLMDEINLQLIDMDSITLVQGNLLVAQGLLVAAVSVLGLLTELMKTAAALETLPLQQGVSIGDSHSSLSDTLVPEVAEITQGD
jgi:hypothetical protein